MEWVSYESREPYDDQSVLLWQSDREEGLPILAYYDMNAKAFIPLFCDQDLYIKGTHWMPVPDAPDLKKDYK